MNLFNYLSAPPRCRQGKAALPRAFGGYVLLVTLACTQSSRTQGPTPAITRFEAKPDRVERGAEVALEAAFANGSGMVDPQVGTLAGSGTLTVRPLATTTYTLTVTNAQGKTAQTRATVTVNPGLEVVVEGHEGVAGEVTVEGPEGFHRTLIASGTLTGLKAGAYTVHAAPAHRGDQVFHPWKPLQELAVETGTAVRVSYPAPNLSLALPGRVLLELVLIPAGRFDMGNDYPADPTKLPSPSPVHPVNLREAFYLARYPTTVAQWEAILGPGSRPGHKAEEAVDLVSFDDLATSFLPKLNRKVPGHGFRLPSEAEWEYACRSGTTTVFFHGDDPASVFDYAMSIADYQASDYCVGHKRPNPWGLYDLNGLVFQWCEDAAHDDYQGAPGDGSPWLDPCSSSFGEDRRILRGYPPLPFPGKSHLGNSTDRFDRPRDYRVENLGFRLAASAESH